MSEMTAIAGNDHPAGATMAVVGEEAAHAKRSKWRTAAVVTGFALLALVLAVLVLGLLAAAGVSSYDNLWHLATAHHVPMARLNPLELDFGLVVVTLADITLTLIGHPFAGLRWLARLLGLGTIAANVAAGWPDPVGGFLRAFAPAIIVALTEAVRAYLLRRDDAVPVGIPAARWVLAPVPTFVLWRRMKLWGVRSYREAVDMELSRLVAIEQLADRYPQGWREAAPADLVFMLTRGVRMAEALGRVAELVRIPEPPEKPEPAPAPRPQAPARQPARPARRKPKTVAPDPDEAIDLDAENRILSLVNAGEIDVVDGILQLVANGRKPSEAGPLVNKSDSYGRRVVRQAEELAKSAPSGQEK
jgi:hypothetical protein